MKHQKRSEYLSPVEQSAIYHEDAAAKYVEKDRNATRAGFQAVAEGVGGKDLERLWFQPLNDPACKKTFSNPDAREEKNSDREAIESAIRASALVPVYEHREHYLPALTQKLYRRIVSVMKKRGIWRDLAPTDAEIMRYIKYVPCLEHVGMDNQRGVDAFFVFHDPEAFRSQQFHPGTTDAINRNEVTREATYWNPDKDTIVTIDATADLATKFRHSQEEHNILRADIFASKLGSQNHWYLKEAAPNMRTEVEDKSAIRNEESRIHILANRIVDIYEAKSGRLDNPKLDHIFSPKKRLERKDQRSAATGQDRAQKEKLKKQKRKEQSAAAKQKKAERKRAQPR